MILSATGHRPDKLGGYGPGVYERLLALAMSSLTRLQPDEVISGMALGWDTAVAEAAYLLDIPFHAYLPFQSQACKWPRDAQRLHQGLCKVAASVVVCSDDPYAGWKMQVRNDCMEAASDEILALYNGDAKGGTYNAVQNAQRKGKVIHNVWKEWEGTR